MTVACDYRLPAKMSGVLSHSFLLRSRGVRVDNSVTASALPDAKLPRCCAIFRNALLVAPASQASPSPHPSFAPARYVQRVYRPMRVVVLSWLWPDSPLPPAPHHRAQRPNATRSCRRPCPLHVDSLTMILRTLATSPSHVVVGARCIDHRDSRAASDPSPAPTIVARRTAGSIP